MKVITFQSWTNSDGTGQQLCSVKRWQTFKDAYFHARQVCRFRYSYPTRVVVVCTGWERNSLWVWDNDGNVLTKSKWSEDGR